MEGHAWVIAECHYVLVNGSTQLTGAAVYRDMEHYRHHEDCPLFIIPASIVHHSEIVGIFVDELAVISITPALGARVPSMSRSHFTLRIPYALNHTLKREAHRRSMSVNALVNEYLLKAAAEAIVKKYSGTDEPLFHSLKQHNGG